MAQEAIRIHKTLPLASLSLATAIANFGIFAALKKNQKTSAIINGNGPLKTILVEINEEGNIRALIGNPNVATEKDNDDFNNIPLILGIGNNGTLKIVNQINDLNFGGEVKLARGDIITDLAYYFDQSEQINTAILADVRLENQTKLQRAIGVIFQMLPNNNKNDIKWIQNYIKNNKLSNLSIKEYIKKINGKLINTQKVKWKCSCSKEKIKKIVNLLKPQEKLKLIKKYGQINIDCNYCKRKYIYK